MWDRLFLAPEGRQVYRLATYANIIKSQRDGRWERLFHSCSRGGMLTSRRHVQIS